MNASQKSEALRLADKYEAHGFLGDHRFAQDHWCRQAAAELRRQHARIAELEAQLSAIGAGGVEPLRKSANQQAAHHAEGVPVQAGTYAEARECEHCNHVGINDSAEGVATCVACQWIGDSPKEDKCPDCEAEGTMTASCPKCHHEYRLIADATLAATQPAAQGMDARDAAFEAVRKAFCKLQRYSFFLDGAGNVRRCADHCGNWVEFDAVHTLFEPQSVDAALAAQAKKGGAA